MISFIHSSYLCLYRWSKMDVNQVFDRCRFLQKIINQLVWDSFIGDDPNLRFNRVKDVRELTVQFNNLLNILRGFFQHLQSGLKIWNEDFDPKEFYPEEFTRKERMCLGRVKFVFFRYNFTLGRALFEMQKDFEEVNNRTLLYSVNAELIMIRFKYRVQYLAQIGYFPEHVAEKLSKVLCPRYRQDQFYGINPNITTIIAGFFYLLLPQRFP